MKTTEKKVLGFLPLASGIYMIPDTTNVGVVTEKQGNSTNIWLVDSGSGRNAGQKILKLFEKMFPPDRSGHPSYKLCAILCTHSHADHISGNAYLAEKTGCGIWITKGEQPNLENPFFEEAFICGGYPFPEIQTPFYQAKPSVPTKIIKQNEKVLLPGGTKISFIPMPGHHFEMTGILVSNSVGQRVFFLGDAIFGKIQMKKYWIPFLFDVGSFKKSLKRIAAIKADCFVPSHGTIETDIEALAELNRIAVVSTEKTILDILESPHTADEILKAVADKNGITLAIGQFVLIGSTLRSYLSYLYRCGLIHYIITDNRMYWEKIPG